ncbi:MAG: hypothetical protein B6245_11260 [Desulfobacteraceae bacterium 4572_88]|nr:MAG: hypothetical protein B6245_11260 [Desulfobacteraceae bacterium 4572_88]
MGTDVLRDLMSQADAVREDFGPRTVRMWLFAHDGLTAEAEDFAREHGILWSARPEFDALLLHLGLRTLPEL